MGQVAAKGQSGRMGSDMKVHMKRRCVTFSTLCGKTKWHPLTFIASCGMPMETVDASIVRQQEVFQQW